MALWWIHISARWPKVCLRKPNYDPSTRLYVTQHYRAIPERSKLYMVYSVGRAVMRLGIGELKL